MDFKLNFIQYNFFFQLLRKNVTECTVKLNKPNIPLRFSKILRLKFVHYFICLR